MLMTRSQLVRIEALERASAGDEWESHPDTDIYRVYPWMAHLSESELARVVAGDLTMDELQAVGEARRAAANESTRTLGEG
jgi:hypothetical protein